jgi:hypothetical protein
VPKHSIIIVSQKFDPHADQILVMLYDLGHTPFRINTEDIPERTTLAVSNAASRSRWAGALTTPERVLDLDDVRSVLWRRPGTPDLPPALGTRDRRFCLDETLAATRGIWALLGPAAYWMSHPQRIREASSKIGQLSRAADLGLEVPRTLVTNEPDRVREFFETCERRMIYKTLYSPLPAPALAGSTVQQQWEYSVKNPDAFKYFVLTTPIRESDLDQLDTLRLAPGLFQEYVPKRVELRVTVIGDDVFAAEIHSQDHAGTQDDFRHWDVDFRMAEHHLPDDVAKQCLELTRSYGLTFSTSDLVVTPDGRYVFLEMNPNGQWLWVQQRVPTLRMAEAMVACLVRGATS